MNLNRLEGEGALRRDRSLAFTFDGRRYSGHPGDTLASALLAAGIRTVARSFKYHRRRGILTAGSEEPNALVELRSGARREPNTRATVIELFDGLEARSQNRWPALGLDLGAVNSLLSPMLVAGFYYKTFMWPAAFWEKVYEPLIRRAAGLGRASLEPDPDRYEKAHAFCDLLVVGAGPAGLAAALAAGRAGARVILCDEDFLAGGRLNADRREIDGESGARWARQVADELASLPETRVMLRTTVFGAYDGNTFGALERVSDHLREPEPHQPRQRLWKIVARRTVLAAGALERPIVFGGNDRPGVMLAGAVRTYVNRFRVRPGRRTAVFTACDDGWKTAFDLFDAGIEVPVVVDSRPRIAAELAIEGNRRGLRVVLGAHVCDADGAAGVRRIEVRDERGRSTRVAADALAVSGGWNPNTALSTHLGARPRWCEAIHAFVPAGLPGSMIAVGAAAGEFSLSGALRGGAAAGRDAARAAGFDAPVETPPRVDDEAVGGTPLWFVADSRGKAFVDLQHDVTPQDLAIAAREGFQSAELLKRYTTLGMGTDQGKTSAMNGHALAAVLTGRAAADLGTIAARPPYTPVAIGALAGPHRGPHFRPCRLTPSHRWAVSRDAVFVDAGEWRRARAFPIAGEDWKRTLVREVLGVRNGVGVCDVSTLGKIDVQGADAGEFLDRVYANLISSLSVGKARYGIMLREDGIVFDDGTVARFAADHFLLSTTTAQAAKVLQHLEHARQVLWPELDVELAPVTEQWAQFAIAGPRSRALLEALLGGAADICNTALPYLACAEFSWQGRPARLFRISFSGELAYELAVPARVADAVIRAIMTAGEPLAVVPYGLEALGAMRIEKGHVAGAELNGTTTARDLGLARMMSAQKDYIGRVLAARPGLTAPDRPALIGVKPLRREATLRAGAHFLRPGAPPSLANDEGFVSSVTFSPMLGHWIGLGFLRGGPARIGERVEAHDPLSGRDVAVEVTSPVFYDPDGARLRS
ncbi:MAG TPA: sarcosine oxidase subunit alpha family protein [Steroidobacteraceae bacterium]|nr:sarcosine oxidase subunit alpha family protein [Steroidobacteraceae bacterium]